MESVTYELVSDVLADLNLGFDRVEAHEIDHAEHELYAVGTNAAFMIHQQGRPEDEVLDYLRTWGLESDEKAARTLRFVAEPDGRAYVPAYPEAGGSAAPSRNEPPGTSRGCSPNSSRLPT